MSEDSNDLPIQKGFDLGEVIASKREPIKRKTGRIRVTKKETALQNPLEVVNPTVDTATTEIETPPATLDVITHKDEIFKYLEDNDNENLAALWGEFKLVKRGMNEIYDGTYTTRNSYVEAASAFVSFKKRWSLINSVLVGPSAYQASSDAYVDTSLIISNSAFAGLPNGFNYREEANSYECNNPNINNSVIKGVGVLERAKNGKIEHSIIGGERALAGASNMHLVDTYVVDRGEVYYFKDREFKYFALDPKAKVNSSQIK